MRKWNSTSLFKSANGFVVSVVSVLGLQLFGFCSAVASPAFIEPRFELVCEDEDRDGFGWNGVCVCDAQLQRQMVTTEVKLSDNRLGMLWLSRGASYLDCDIHGLSIYERNDNGIWSNKAVFYDLPVAESPDQNTDITHIGQEVFSYLSRNPDNNIYDYSSGGYASDRILNIVRRNEDGSWQREADINIKKSYIYELDHVIAGSTDDAIMYQEYSGRNAANPLIAHSYDKATSSWVKQVINSQPGEFYKDFVISGNTAAAFSYSVSNSWWHPGYIVVFERDAAKQWRETTRLPTDYFTSRPLAFGDTLLIDGDTIVTNDSAKGLYTYSRQSDGRWTRAPDSMLDVEFTYRGYPSYRSRKLSLSGGNLLLAEFAAKSIMQQDENGYWVQRDFMPRETVLDRFELPASIGNSDYRLTANIRNTAISGNNVVFGFHGFLLVAEVDQYGQLTNSVNGCDYSDADVYGGWGWNAATGQSCAPLTDTAEETSTVDANCNYSYASLHDGWGWNAQTQESCPPVSASVVNDTSNNCDYSSAEYNGGWGWDSVARQSCKPLSSETQCVDSDSDSDGWGWDGIDSCISSE